VHEQTYGGLMKIFYWLNLFGSILFMVLASVFLRSHRYTLKLEGNSFCKSDHADNYAYLCGRKLAVHQASISALSRISGISMTSAFAIRDYLRAYKNAKLEDLDERKGIGPKVMAQLREHFY
jgi:hypothetical protein